MTTYLFTLHTPPTKICRYAGQTRDLEFTGTRDELFKHIRYMTRTYEKLVQIKVKQGNKWVGEDTL
jgi:hypothetical protein